MPVPRTDLKRKKVSPPEPEFPRPVHRGPSHSGKSGSLYKDEEHRRPHKERSISDREQTLVQEWIDLLEEPELFRIVVDRNTLTIEEKDRLRYTKDSDRFGFLEGFLDDIPDVKNSYTSMLRFILVDRRRRLFVTERYCFREDVEDWIFLDGPTGLDECLMKYLPHLGRSSFYTLRPFSPEAYHSL